MALIACDFFSESLGLSCSIKVILPQPTVSQIGMRGVVKAKKYPVLWLLHGLSDDHTIWSRHTSIERYLAGTGIAVVMPNAGKSARLRKVLVMPLRHDFRERLMDAPW